MFARIQSFASAQRPFPPFLPTFLSARPTALPTNLATAFPTALAAALSHYTALDAASRLPPAY
jgi:hypothetical protein